jgi:Ca2+-binding RTX toxin-like protein
VSGATVEGSAAAGTLVSTLAAIDPDAGDSHSFAVTGGATHLFELVGNQVRVKEGAPLNVQSESQVALNVTVTDQGGLSHSQTIIVNLTNVGETGTDGDDVLLGTTGADIMKGKAGNDTYLVNSTGDLLVEQSNQGVDLVNAAIAAYTLPTDVENLAYVGSGSFTGIGNNASNKITGAADSDNLSGGSGNDSLHGEGGADTLSGGTGNDSMFGGAGLDSLSGGDGNDVASGGDDADSISGWNGNDRLLGGAGDDLLFGVGGADTLEGGAGADTLNGGAGNDKMAGGAGDDTYFVNAAKDAVTELASEGFDTVESSITLTPGANVERLILTGAGAINGTGNGLDNSLTGNGAANKLNGGSGNDTIDGGAGNDSLNGGQGADTYRLGRGGGKDVITNADTDGQPDTLLLGTTIAADDLWFSRSGEDLVVSVIGSGERATLKAWYIGSNSRLDFQLSDGGSLDAGSVQQLVSAMSFTTTPPSSLSALTSAQQSSVLTATDAAWDP